MKQLPSLWANKEFKAFIFTRFAIIFSLFMQSTAIAYQLYSLTGRAIYLGFIGLAEVIPLVILALFAGHYVDNNDKRKILLKSMVVVVLVSIILLIANIRIFNLHSNLNLYLTLTYTSFFLLGAARAFFGPTSFALLSSLVAKENYAKSIPISTTAFHIGAVTGPLAGGLILAWLGIEAVIVTSLIFLALCVIFIWSISPKPVEKIEIEKESTIKSIQEGLKFVFSNQIILAALCLDMFAVLFGGAESLLPVFSKDILKIGEIGFGWLRSAHGIGSILMMMIIVWFPLTKNVGYKLLFCVMMFGVCMIGFGLSKNVYLSFGILAMGGVFDSVSMVARQSILQYKTPDHLKGRVSSVNNIFVSTSNELGGFESTVMAELMGTVPAVVFGGSMTILVVIIVFVVAKQIRTLTLN